MNHDIVERKMESKYSICSLFFTSCDKFRQILQNSYDINNLNVGDESYG